MTNITEWLSRQKAIFFLIAGLLGAGLLGIVDRSTGSEMSFSIFYLIPIIFVTRFSERWVGILISGASAVAWIMADLTSGRIYSQWTIPYWNALMGFAIFLVNVYLLSKLKGALETERMLSRIDSLTGITNRKYFIELVSNEILSSGAPAHPFTIAYLDLDDLRTINDRFGHNEGDIVLCTVASIIRNNIRTIDTVGRIGGDEFAILFPGMGSEKSREIIPKVHKSLLDAMLENKWGINLDMGVGIFEGANLSVEEILRQTESLMYSVKTPGKSGIKYEVFGH